MFKQQLLMVRSKLPSLLASVQHNYSLIDTSKILPVKFWVWKFYGCMTSCQWKLQNYIPCILVCSYMYVPIQWDVVLRSHSDHYSFNLCGDEKQIAMLCMYVPYKEYVMLGKSFVIKVYQINLWLNVCCWAISSIGTYNIIWMYC